MTNFMTNIFRKPLAIAIGTATLCSVSAGSSALAGEYYVPAAAPITYKMANPAMNSHNMMPHYVQPQQQTFGLPQASGPAATFDQSRIDKNLYANQKVGNPYTVLGQTYYPKHDPSYDMVGTASWYGDKFHGKLTANGETYNKNAMTAAHKTLPLNSFVVVTNMATGQSLTLRINDRGPFIGNRIIDLSEAAANALGYKTAGLGEVRVQYAGPANPAKQAMAAPAPRTAPPAYMQAPSVPSAPHNYQPLRNIPEQFAPKPAPRSAAPTKPLPQYTAPQVPNIMNPAPVMPHAALPQTSAPIPQAYAQNNLGAQEDFVTLTIKGPIHMANSKRSKGKLINANYIAGK